jgi:NADP-dependent 3-hydroxy acid dehydrogenase YdfG
MVAAMTSNGELQTTVAPVTGASSGIGETTAVALAEDGAAVAIAARRARRRSARHVRYARVLLRARTAGH